jgi:hypothetical protein
VTLDGPRIPAFDSLRTGLPRAIHATSVVNSARSIDMKSQRALNVASGVPAGDFGYK